MFVARVHANMTHHPDDEPNAVGSYQRPWLAERRNRILLAVGACVASVAASAVVLHFLF